jgi:hypothetical protein
MTNRSSLSPAAGRATMAKDRSHASAPADVDVLGTIAMLCGAGLVVTLLLATYGLDLSIGFF